MELDRDLDRPLTVSFFSSDDSGLEERGELFFNSILKKIPKEKNNHHTSFLIFSSSQIQ
jgi:hypothetical protein